MPKELKTQFIMTYELFLFSRFYLSPYSQSACAQPSLRYVNDSADGYRILAAKKNYLKGLNWIKTEMGLFLYYFSSKSNNSSSTQSIFKSNPLSLFCCSMPFRCCFISSISLGRICWSEAASRGVILSKAGILSSRNIWV